VITEWVCIGKRFYWTLKHTTCTCTLQITITQTLVFPVTILPSLLGNTFQQWMILWVRAHVPAVWRLSHSSFLLFQLPCQDCSVMAARPRYIASSTTVQKTPLPVTLLLLRAPLLRRSHDAYWSTAQSRSLATAVSLCLQFLLLTFSKYAITWKWVWTTM
jgi:hypothetical protein